MTASMRPQGRLPARVYWFRRGLVLSTLFALIFAFAHVVTGSGGDDPSASAARTAAKTGAGAAGGPTAAPTTNLPIGPLPARTVVPGAAATGAVPTGQLPAPDGVCALDEITATPVAGTFPAGRAIPLTVELTGIRPACTFAVSSKTLVVKIATKAKVWSSQECPGAVKSASVVVRSGTPTVVQIGWSGRESDPTCSRAASWALPGTYHVSAAAIGSEPSQADVRLTTPPRAVVTRTIAPKVRKKKGAGTNLAITPASGRRTAR
ncbi:MAG: hypothetical protein ACJ72D_22900 [Marmoricola sp.]